jgi:hypothetical protein
VTFRSAIRILLSALTLAVLLNTAPITATFNEELQPTFVAMTVVGPDGNL